MNPTQSLIAFFVIPESIIHLGREWETDTCVQTYEKKELGFGYTFFDSMHSWTKWPTFP